MGGRAGKRTNYGRRGRGSEWSWRQGAGEVDVLVSACCRVGPSVMRSGYVTGPPRCGRTDRHELDGVLVPVVGDVVLQPVRAHVKGLSNDNGRTVRVTAAVSAPASPVQAVSFDHRHRQSGVNVVKIKPSTSDGDDGCDPGAVLRLRDGQ